VNFKEFILNESKQEILALEFPKVIADIIYEHFGKNAFLVAKWNKDYSSYNDKENWWFLQNTSYSTRSTSLGDYVRLYEAPDIEQYKKIYHDIFDKESNIKDYEIEEQKEWLKKRIEADLLDSTFFSYITLIKDIKDGILTDLAPYKKLTYQQAQEKYDKKQMFKDSPIVKSYENGWKWINIGKKCHLLGKMMKNCGSVGVMGNDPERTIITLFDKGNKPHVMVTYSPNEKRISGDEGIGSSRVKDQYSDYIIDLAKLLDSNIDTRTSSKLIKLKSLLGDRITKIEKLENDSYNEFYKITLDDNKEYVTDSYFLISVEDLQKIKERYKYNYKQALNFNNRPKIEFENKDIKYIKISN
jgi:hypothetical protein